MNDQQQILVLQARLSDMLEENTALKAADALAENVELKRQVEAAKVKSQSQQNYTALIHRRAKKLTAAGLGYEAILLLKSIGE